MRATQINHIGIAVRDLEEAAQVYQAMGLCVVEVVEVPEQKVKVAMIPIGSSMIELVQPTSADSAVSKHIEARGEGLHHLALEVQEIEGALADLAAQGVQLIDSTPRQGAEGQIAFLHPKSTGRVLIELVETEG